MISSEIPFLKRSFFPVSRDFARYVSGLWALFRTFQYYAQENCPKNTGPVPRVVLYVSSQLRGFSQLFVLFRSRALRCKHRSAICADFAAPIYRYIGVISDDLSARRHFRNHFKVNRGDYTIRNPDNETNAQLKAFAKIGNFRSPFGRVSR